MSHKSTHRTFFHNLQRYPLNTCSEYLWMSQALPFWVSSCKHCTMCCGNLLLLRRLKLHGQNAPKAASPRHCEKIVLLGGPKNRRTKNPVKSN